jgi:uncharacterized protein (TIGR02145 family)
MKNIGLLLLLLFLFCSYSYSQNPCPNVATVVYAGKTYNTVQIGSQCWLKENLDVGTRIDGLAEQTNNGTIEKYCYNDSLANCTLYGGLYEWNEAMQYVTTEGTKGICPTGWHIPTYDEYGTLKATVSNDGNALKAVGQGTGGGAGTNTSGFFALLAGDRYSNGYFFSLGLGAIFWSSTENDATYADNVYLYGDNSGISFSDDNKGSGISVRCAKDASTGMNDHSDNTLPKSIDLFQNYPNPFNPNTVISYSLPTASNVKLIVFNSLGQTVKVLENGFKNAGNYSVNFNATELSSGTYFYKIEAGQFSPIKKMILLK